MATIMPTTQASTVTPDRRNGFIGFLLWKWAAVLQPHSANTVVEGLFRRKFLGRCHESTRFFATRVANPIMLDDAALDKFGDFRRDQPVAAMRALTMRRKITRKGRELGSLGGKPHGLLLLLDSRVGGVRRQRGGRKAVA